MPKTFQTTHLVGIHLWIRTSLSISGSSLFATLNRLFSGVTIASRPRLPMAQGRSRDIQASFPGPQSFILHTVTGLHRL